MHRNYLVCYDIKEKKRLARVRKTVYSYALGGQKSAIEAPLDDDMLKELADRLQKIIKKEDKINIIEYSGDPACFGRADFLKFEKGAIII